jgi:hypothetical protein
MVARHNELIVKANREIYESENVVFETDRALNTGAPFFYVWLHYPPEFDERGRPRHLAPLGRVEPVFTPSKEMFMGVVHVTPP